MGNKARIKQTLGDLAISVAAIVFSLVISALIMLIAGYDPIQAFSALLNGAFGSMNSIANAQARPTKIRGVAFARVFAMEFMEPKAPLSSAEKACTGS